LRILEGPKLLLILGYLGSSEIVAFLNVFRDIGLTNSEITSGCYAKGSPEPMMLAGDIGFMIDCVVVAVRRGSSLLLAINFE
jgi:hypothetical protein